MTKKLIEKVMKYGIVDTKKYRYRETAEGIKRLPLEYLGTVKAFENWELVYSYR